MGYVIVDTKTRCSVQHPRTRRKTYSTEAAARAAMTRMGAEGHEVMDTASYAAQVPMIEVVNHIRSTVAWLLPCIEAHNAARAAA